MRQLSWLMSQFAAMRVLGGLPVKTPMLFSSRRQESSSVVTHDSSSFPCSSCPLLGNPFRPYLVRKIRRRSEQMETMISSIFWGVARKSLASCLFERGIDSINKNWSGILRLVLWDWSGHWSTIWLLPRIQMEVCWKTNDGKMVSVHKLDDNHITTPNKMWPS